jgi:hypothetical protein
MPDENRLFFEQARDPECIDDVAARHQSISTISGTECFRIDIWDHP